MAVISLLDRVELADAQARRMRELAKLLEGAPGAPGRRRTPSRRAEIRAVTEAAVVESFWKGRGWRLVANRPAPHEADSSLTAPNPRTVAPHD